MRFQTLMSLAVVGLATSVYAQYNSTLPGGAGCTTCMVNAVIAIPACSGNIWNPNVPIDPSQITGDQKKCFCTFVSNTNWANGCISPTTCSQELINEMDQSFASDKNAYCVGFSATSGNSGAISSKNGMALTVATLATTATAAMMLL